MQSAKTAIWTLAAVPVTVLLTILIGVVILLVFLTIPYKIVVYIVAKLFKKELLNFVHGMDGLVAIDSIHTQPKSALNYFVILNGTITLERLRQIFQDRIINKKLEDQTDEYSRFRQYCDHFGGYNFWRWDRNFDIKNHIHEFQSKGKKYSQKDLPELMSKIVSKPFTKNQSPWEAFLLHDFKYGVTNDPKTLIIFRFHHTVGDGLSLHNVLQRDLQENSTPLRLPQPRMSKRVISPWQKYFGTFFGIYEISQIILKRVATSTAFHNQNPWHDSTFESKHSRLEKIQLCGKVFTCIVDPIPVKKIKELKNKFQVEFITILVTIFCGGIRRLLLHDSQTTPSKMNLVFSTPKLNHPGGLVNHFYVGTEDLPMGEKETIKRLKVFDCLFKKQLYSLVPKLYVDLIKLLALLPPCILEHSNILAGTPPCLAFTNLPVAEEPSQIDGVEVLDFFFGAVASAGFGCIMVNGDGGKIRMVALLDRNCCSSQESFKELQHFIEQEFKVLESFPVD